MGWPYFRNAHEVVRLCPNAHPGGAPNLAPQATGRCQKLTDRWPREFAPRFPTVDCYSVLHVKLIYAARIFVQKKINVLYVPYSNAGKVC